MTPPEADDGSPPASFVLAIEPLRRRADFLACARGLRVHAPSLVLQGRPRGDGSSEVRAGLTCSRKLGSAVHRNRARRRLREAARQVLARRARPGWDYVLIGRPEITETCPFPRLLADLESALERLHRKADGRGRPIAAAEGSPS